MADAAHDLPNLRLASVDPPIVEQLDVARDASPTHPVALWISARALLQPLSHAGGRAASRLLWRRDAHLCADERIRALIETRRKAYAGIFDAIVEEEQELQVLYAPIKTRIDAGEGSLSKLSFSVRRQVDIETWASDGEALLDLRTAGPFKGRGELLRIAREMLLPAWSTGDAAQAANALLEFARSNEDNLRAHRPESEDVRSWASRVAAWLFSTDHITVGYGLQYDGVDIEQLSPGTRGIVLLLQDFLVEAHPISQVGDHVTGSLAEPKATSLTRPFSCWQVCGL